jgi:nicotinamide-nucleotide amidase
MTDAKLTVLAEELGNELHAHEWRVACAESCTGGWLAKVITDISGSSQWFDRGFVTYSNASKVDMLGVSEALLQLHGAVSVATATAMANGALQYSRADLTVAITGIAGPGGGTLEKPVGTVWFAWARRDGKLETAQQLFKGDRTAIRQQAVQTALEGLLRCSR